MFRITLLEPNAQVLGGCALACRLFQKVGERCRSRLLPHRSALLELRCSRSRKQHPELLISGVDTEPGDEVLRLLCFKVRDLAKVAGHPRCF